jgi:hypothetical protein
VATRAVAGRALSRAGEECAVGLPKRDGRIQTGHERQLLRIGTHWLRESLYFLNARFIEEGVNDKKPRITSQLRWRI